jgi:hypothetical protein
LLLTVSSNDFLLRLELRTGLRGRSFVINEKSPQSLRGLGDRDERQTGTASKSAAFYHHELRSRFEGDLNKRTAIGKTPCIEQFHTCRNTNGLQAGAALKSALSYHC